jgi:hypothetical protein
MPFALVAAIALVASGVFAYVVSHDDEPSPRLPAPVDRRPDPSPAKIVARGPDPTPPTAPTKLTAPDPTPPDPTPQAPAFTAAVSINATPWAEVRLDGRRLGNTPRRNVTVPAGNHVIELYQPQLNRRARVPLRITTPRRIQVIADLTRDPPAITIR